MVESIKYVYINENLKKKMDLLKQKRMSFYLYSNCTIPI